MALGTPYTVCQGNETVSVSTTTFAVTVTGATATGDAIAVAVLNNNTLISSVSDSQGNTYALVTSETLTSMHVSLYAATTGPGGTGPTAALTTSDTITATVPATGATVTLAIIARACPGADPAGPDANASGSASNASGTAVSVSSAGTTAADSEWVIFIVGDGSGGGSPTSLGGTGTWAQQAQQHTAGNPWLTWYDQVISSAQALSGTATVSLIRWGALIAGLPAAAAGASPAGPVPAAPGQAWRSRFSVARDRTQAISFQPPAVATPADPDSGTGADSESPPPAALSDTDSGTGTESVSSLTASFSDPDSGTGAEAGAASPPPVPGPALPGPAWIRRFGTPRARRDFRISYQPTPPVTIPDADSGSGAEAVSSLAVSLSDTDSGTGTEAVSSLAASLSSSDTGSGTDAGPSVSLSTTDSGTATDAGPSVSLSSSDAGTGAETVSSLAASLSSPDTGTGTEAVTSLAVTLSDSDAGTGAEAGAPQYPAAPASPAAPGPAWTRRFGAPQARRELRTSFQSPASLLALSGTDSGTGTEAVTSLVVTVSDSDSGTGTEAVTVLAVALSDADSGTGTEVLLSPVPPAPVVVTPALPGAAWTHRFGTPQARRDIRSVPVPQTWSATVSDSDFASGYDAAPPSRIRRVGAALGSGTAGDQTVAQFTSSVGGPYYGEGYFFYQASIPASLTAAPQNLSSYAGQYRARVDFELTHYGSTNADGTANTYVPGGANTVPAACATQAQNLAAFIASCQAGQLDLMVGLWHEPYSKFNVALIPSGTNPATGTAWTQQDANNLDYANSIGYFGAVLRAYGIPVTFDPSNFSANASYGHWAQAIGNAAAPGLGWAACAKGFIDEIATDIYVNEPGNNSSQGTFDTVAALADAFGLPLGIFELGFAPGTNSSYTPADTDTYSSYVLSYFLARAAAGKPVSDITAWATNDNASVAGMYLASGWSATTVSRYVALFAKFDSQPYGGPGGSIGITSSDSASASDAATRVAVTGSDAAVTSETGSAGSVTGSDLASGAESVSSLAVSFSDSDAGSGVDLGSLGSPVSDSDSASASEAAGVGTAIPVTQVGSPGVVRLAAAGTVTPAWGAGQPDAAGDLLVIIVSCQASGAITSGPGSPRSGFTRVAHALSTASGAHTQLDIYTKPAAGSDTLPTFTFAASGTVAIQCVLVELTAANTVSLDSSGTWGSGATAQTLTSETITSTGVVTGGGEYAIAALCRESLLSATVYAPGTGWTSAYSDAGVSSTGHLSVDVQPGPPSGSAVSDTGTWSDAGTTAYGSAAVIVISSASVAITESDAGSGSDALVIGIAGADSAAAAEAGTAVHPGTPFDSDSAAAAEAVTRLQLSDFDVAAGTDALTAISVASTDSAAAAEAVTRLQLSDSDVAAGVTTAVITAASSSPDAGTAAESGAVSVVLGDPDAGTGTDAFSVLTGRPAAAEAAAAAEALQSLGIISSAPSSETATGAESVSALAARLSDSDSGSGVSSVSQAVAVTSSDSARSAELGTLAGRLVSDDDSGVAHESDFGFPADAETATGAEAALIGPGDSDAATAAEISLSQWPASADSAVAAEAGYWTGPLADAETATGAESVIQIALTASETAAGTEGDGTTGLAGSLDVWATAPPTHSTAGYYRLTWRMPDGTEREIYRTPSLGEYLARHREARAHRLRGGPVNFLSDSDSAASAEQTWSTASVLASVAAVTVVVAVHSSALVVTDVPVSSYTADGPLFRDPALGLAGG